MPHNHYFRDFIVSSDTKKTTERTEDTESLADSEIMFRKSLEPLRLKL